MPIRPKHLLLLIGGVLWLCISCTRKRDLSQNILLVHLLAEPKGLHPTNDNNAYQRMIFQCTQKRLLGFDLEQNKMVPELLAEYPQLLADSTSLRCRLRDDIRWDDGSRVSVEDVAFTLKVIVCPLIKNPDQKGYFENFRSLVPDPMHKNGFIVLNRNRYYDFESMLSQVYLLQKKYWDPNGVMDKVGFAQMLQEGFKAEDWPGIQAFAEEFNSARNGREPGRLKGLGPYQVSEWQTGASITLVRKPQWWGRHLKEAANQAWPDKIVFTVIKDMEPLVLALKKQDIDVSMELSTSALNKLRKRAYFNRAYYSEYVGSFSYTYMGMNMKPEGGRTPFFTDLRVRRAMAHLVPVDEIIQVSARGIGKRIASFGMPGQADYNEAIPLVEPDIEEASRLLNEAGWVDTDGDHIRDKIIDGKKVPFSFSLSYMISPVTKEIAQIIRNNMYKAGIEVKADPMDFVVFYKQAAAHAFDAMLGSWSSSAGAEDPRQLWHTESWANNGSNFTGFGNAYTDSLIQVMNQEMNPGKRSRMMKQFQAIVAEEQPYVFMYNATRKIAIHKRFDHARIYPERPHVILNNLRLASKYRNSSPDNY